MEFFFTTIAFITAGASLVTGLINLFAGLHKDGEKVDLAFGILALLVFLFFMLPPVGFIVDDKAPYSLAICIKRVFIWSHYALLPWFFSVYSGYRNSKLVIAIDALLLLSYVIMVFTKEDSMKPVWVLVSLVPLGLILVHGLLAAIYQIRQDQRKRGRWLLAAMVSYGVLFIPGVFNQLGNNYFGNMLGTKLFFPFHLNLLAFIAIMSVRLRANTFEKYRLEKRLNREVRRWNSVVNSMQLMVVELDRDGNILFLNPYAISALGYKSDPELLNQNWFDTFATPEELNRLKVMYADGISSMTDLPDFTAHIQSRNGKSLVLKWTNVFIYDNDKNLTGTMNVGIDITEQEGALEQVKLLKNELEKENLLLKGEKMSDGMETNIIGHSDALLYAIQKVRQVANTNAGVLLQGETGVGKELFAHLIHQYSHRNKHQYIRVNCAALPPELIESELFGHEKGSFTGALQSRKGRFELADGGTIFLDEIGELPLSLQPKLLRVLQSGEFERIGGQQTIKVDVRVIAATNRDLLQEVKLGQFREDLFYRLNVFPVTIPPLRKRKEDIPLLVAHFVKKFSNEHKKNIGNISKADMIRLTEYSWPGNVRELINVIERSIISSAGSTMKLEWLNGHSPSENDIEYSLSIKEVEKNYILKVLDECNWKINGEDGAAVKLGLHPSTLRSRLKKLNISRDNL